jgi:hypothetical protein
MEQRYEHLVRVVGLVILGGLFVVGCRSAPSRTQTNSAIANLKAIHVAYKQFITDTGRAPQNLQELAKSLPEYDQTSLDRLMRSPNDGQPYRMMWGLEVQSGQPVVLAHEQNGVDGSRYVLMTDGSCRLMTQAEFDQAARAQR